MLKSIQKKKNKMYAQRKARVRGKIHGTAELPRLTVFRSNKHFYAQAIDDDRGRTLAYAAGRNLGLKATKEDVKKVAADMAEKLKAANIERIVIDRNGYLYPGVVAYIADAHREAGMKG